MKKLIFFVPLLSFLTSCQPLMTREQELAIYRSRCLDYGYQWGTREFADCMMEQEAREEKLAVQRQKAYALEERNRIEQQKVWVKEKEVEQKRKKKK